MDFALTEQQLALKALAREFAEKEIRPRVREYYEKEYLPRDLVQRAAVLGFLGGVIPQEYGGSGLDFLSFTLMVEEIARVCQVMGAVVSFASGLHGSSVLRYGTKEQKRRYLVPLAKGEVMAAAAVTEPGSGTDVAGMQTTVVKKNGGYVLNGSKAWISNLDHAEWFVTFANLDRSKRHEGICAFIVEKDWPGVSVHPYKNKVGFRPLCTGEVVLQDVYVPVENLLGKEGEGFQVAMCAVENGRLGVAARACGMLQACLEESIAYAKERVVFGQPIGRYQLIQSKIADLAVGLETARLLTYRLAWLKDQGASRARLESSMAKLYASDMLMKLVVEAAQIFGAYSCSPEFAISRLYQDAKFFQIVEGTNEIHRVLIAEILLGYRKG